MPEFKGYSEACDYVYEMEYDFDAFVAYDPSENEYYVFYPTRGSSAGFCSRSFPNQEDAEGYLKYMLD